MPKPSEPFFPDLPSISQYFTDDFYNHNGSLSPAESVMVSKATPKRLLDFKTGRYCARQALSNLINDRPEILQGKNREPLWPNGIVGSISHSSKLAGAVVARQNDITAIGLDIENIAGVKPDMWHLLFNHTEQEFIRQKSDHAAFWATLFFSFKESFYKMQYPITGLFLDFSDIVISEKDLHLNFSQANPHHDLSAIDLNNIKMHWIVTDDQLITLCYI